MSSGVRQRFSDGAAHDLAVADESVVSRICVLDAVLRAAQHSHECRRLIKELLEALSFVLRPLLSLHPVSGFDACAKETSDLAALIADRRVGKSEVGLFKLAVSVQCEPNVVHLDGCALEHLGEERCERFARFSPDDI